MTKSLLMLCMSKIKNCIFMNFTLKNCDKILYFRFNFMTV